jgi:hypothetical protein
MVPRMIEGVTTAIVAFIFVCILFPKLVKNSTQFYAAFGLIVIMLFLTTLAGIIGSEGFYRLVRALNGLLQLTALVLLVLSAGGLSLKELAGEFKDAVEVIRRGESDKEVIIPLSSQANKPRRGPAAAAAIDEDDEGDGPVVHVITPPPPAPPPGATPAEPKPPTTGTIPLD